MRQGFSLIELIVVISIIAIILLATLPNYKRVSRAPTTNFLALNAASALRKAQAQAFSQNTVQSAEGMSFAPSGNPIPGKYGTIIVDKIKKVIVSNCGRVRIE